MKNGLIKEVLAKKWHFYVSRKFNWFVENTQILANRRFVLEKAVGFDVSQENYLILNGDEYYTDAESEKFNNVFDRLVKRDIQFFKKFATIVFSIGKRANKYRLELNENDYKKISHKRLAENVEKFQEIYTLSFVPAFTRPDDYLEVKTKQLIKRDLLLNDKKVEKWFEQIATYPKLGELAYNEEPLKLLEIARKLNLAGCKSVREIPQEIDKKIDTHIQKYSWMKAPVASGEELFKKADYLERIENMLTKKIDDEIKRVIEVRIQNEVIHQRLIQTPELKPDTLNLIKAVRSFIFLRTFATEASDELFYVAKTKLFKEVAKRLNLPISEVVMLSSDEIVLALNDRFKDMRKVIEDRLVGFAIVWLGGKCFVIFGKEVLRLQNYVSKTIIPSNLNKTVKAILIKGKSASLGRIIGKVKVLRNYCDIYKVEKGDILVASMTTPDYVLAMEKASAFVTDEGGITCHAAILAREFGVPCVVGTGNATKILRDNQIVEVNANTGIVKIISE